MQVNHWHNYIINYSDKQTREHGTLSLKRLCEITVHATQNLGPHFREFFLGKILGKKVDSKKIAAKILGTFKNVGPEQ